MENAQESNAVRVGYDSVSAEVTASNGIHYRVTVWETREAPGKNGRWTCERENLSTEESSMLGGDQPTMLAELQLVVRDLFRRVDLGQDI